jgi:hypothetical protein
MTGLSRLVQGDADPRTGEAILLAAPPLKRYQTPDFAGFAADSEFLNSRNRL